jgi:PCFT/HCP family folate transporter-like MFS transporter 1/3
MNCREICVSFWKVLAACYRARLLAVELVPMVAILVRMVYTPMSEQYYYKKYGEEILKNTTFFFPDRSFCVSSRLIDRYTGINGSYKAAESSSSHLVIYCQVAHSVTSIVTTVILGPVMDKFGRSIGMVLPFIGMTVQGIVSIFIISFNLNPYYFIVAYFIGGGFGGLTTVMAATFSYVADVTSLRWRSLRVAIVEAAMAVGSFSGQFVNGYWLKRLDCDFMPPIYFYTGCNFAVLVFVVFVLPESLSFSERETLGAKSPRGIRVYIEGFKLYCGKLPLVSTWKLYATTAVALVVGSNIFGAILIDVYFLKAEPFDFDSLQIGIFEALKFASRGLANFFIVGLFTILGVGDVWLILVGISIHITCNMLLGFSVATWQLYTGKQVTASYPIQLQELVVYSYCVCVCSCCCQGN